MTEIIYFRPEHSSTAPTPRVTYAGSYYWDNSRKCMVSVYSAPEDALISLLKQSPKTFLELLPSFGNDRELLREAYQHLEQIGVIKYHPHRGWFFYVSN